VDRAGALALGRVARRLLVKVGSEVVRLDASGRPLPDAVLERYLVHEDGFLRVPVLVVADLLVRGYTEALYREALALAPAP
jgi:hypothetical protein